MKHLLLRFWIISLIFLFNIQGFAQEPAVQQTDETPRVFVIVKNDGTRFYGNILSQDAREVLIETKELGQVYIPRHEIREIREIASRELDEKGFYVPGEVFSTRYFVTTNGLPIQKGENYVIWNLYGPDIQFGVSDNLGLGLMTTWIGYPIVGTAKYSIPLNKDWNLGLGMLLGTGSWGIPDLGMALPFGAISYGDRIKNFTFSAGYGGVWYKQESYTYSNGNYNTSEDRISEGNFLISVAGMVKLGRTLSLVFDSFIMPRGGTYETIEYSGHYDWESGNYYEYTQTVTNKRHSIAVFIPGLRFQTRPEAAFQIGFAGIRADGETMALPIPMVQWFRKL
jgi:hypothetical protein